MSEFKKGDIVYLKDMFGQAFSGTIIKETRFGYRIMYQVQVYGFGSNYTRKEVAWRPKWSVWQ